MKKIVFILLMSNLCFASTGWFSDFVIINSNGSGDTYYWIGSDPSFGTELNGQTFSNALTLLITGVDMKYWSDTQDRTGGAFYWQVTTAGGGTIVSGPTEVIWSQAYLSGNDYQGTWSGSINVLEGLSASSSYELHIWAKTWGTGQGDMWLSNSGSNYVASITTDSSLPVSLTDFSGVAVSDGVKLAWTTESEMENLGFNLYRKATSGDYTLLASYIDVPALAGVGSSSAMHKYAYTDQAVAAGMTYSYLLGDVSYDGVEKKHSDKVISVTVPENGLAVAEDFMIGSVYPNPFNAEFTIPFSLSKPMAVEIALYDVNGNRVKSISSGTMTSGLHHVRTNASDLSTGLYFVKILAGDRQFAQKLMLIK